jgi:hypothetical protein
MKPEDVDARKLADLLCLAGASCECGLDRSWMQGPMIPLAWTRQDQARIAAELGFDPESPLVALEMRQILAQAGAGAPETQAGLADIPASGYREVSLASLTPPEEEPEAPPAEQAAQDPPRPPDAARTLPAAAVGQEAGPPPQDETRRGPRRNYGVWTLVAALVLVNLAGTFRIWRRRQRSRSA